MRLTFGLVGWLSRWLSKMWICITQCARAWIEGKRYRNGEFALRAWLSCILVFSCAWTWLISSVFSSQISGFKIRAMPLAVSISYNESVISVSQENSNRIAIKRKYNFLQSLVHLYNMFIPKSKTELIYYLINHNFSLIFLFVIGDIQSVSKGVSNIF